MGILVRVVVNAVALAVAAWLVDGIRVGGGQQEQVVTLVVVAVIFGLVNAIVSPVVKLLSLPFIILTLGLLLLVINAAMLMLTGALAQALGLAFHVGGFWPALLGAVIVTIVSWGLDRLVDED